MRHPASVRATSLTASALALTALVLLAVSARIPLVQDLFGQPPAIPIVREPDPPPPKPPEPQPPRAPPAQDQTIAAPVPTSTSFEPVETILPLSEPAAASERAGVAGPPYIEITRPTWLQRPRDLARYYPRRAAQVGREGVAVLDCLVTTTGHLNCAVIEETPRGWNFGDAALQIAADHQMAPALRDGVAIEGRYRMRVPFNLN